MYHFFKISYLKLFILVFGLLLVGIISGDYKTACFVSTFFLGAGLVLDAAYHLERKSKKK